MKHISVSAFPVFVVVCVAAAASSGSMLVPAQFPKTADDLTFRQSMDLLTEGYDVFDTVFDSNGKCIKNCPYVGMTIQEFNHRMDVAEQQAQQDLAELNMQNPIQSTDLASDGNVSNQDLDAAAQQVQQDLAELSTQNQMNSNVAPRPGGASENGAITDNAALSYSNTPESGTASAYYAASSNNSNSNSIRDALRNQNQQSPQVLLDNVRNHFQQSSSGAQIPVTCPLGDNTVRVSSDMKCRNGRNHNGIDLPISVGSPVYAAADGRVVIRKNDSGGYGYYLSIEHAKGYYTVYGHLSQWLVSNGQTVRAGQQIAKSGNTGRSTGPHLHFEVLKGGALVRGYGGVPVNPRNITQCKWNPKNTSSNTNNNRC